MAPSKEVLVIPGDPAAFSIVGRTVSAFYEVRRVECRESTYVMEFTDGSRLEFGGEANDDYGTIEFKPPVCPDQRAGLHSKWVWKTRRDGVPTPGYFLERT